MKDWRYLGLMFVDYFFLRLGNLFFLISFILVLAFGDEETTIMPSILIFFFFPFYLLKRWVVDSQMTKALMLETYRKIKKIVFWTRDFYRDSTWGELLVGDIVLVKRHDVFPADILILDSENDECLLQTKFVDGKTYPTKKKAIKLTRVSKHSPFKGNLEEYKKILTGKFQYDPPSKDLDSFKGTLKLKKDPISEELTIQNLCLKGSVLTYSDWVIGIVVYVGSDVKIVDPRSLWKNFEDDFLSSFLNKLNIMSLVLILILCLICIIRISSNNEPFHQIFKDNSMEILFTNLINLIPTNVHTLVESLTILYKYLLEKKYKGSMELYNPSRLPYLSQVSHMVLDRSTCIDDSEAKIHSIYLANMKNFFVSQNFLEKEQNSLLHEAKLNKLITKTSPVKAPPSENDNDKEPKMKILFAKNDSLKLIIPEDGFLSVMPSLNKCKFNKENDSKEFSLDKTFIHTTSMSFQGQGETKNIPGNGCKQASLVMTLGKVVNKEECGDPKLLVHDDKMDGSKSQPLSDFASPDLHHRFVSAEIEKLGSLNELMGNVNIVPSKFEEIFKGLLLAHDIRSKEDFDSSTVLRECHQEKSYINEFSIPESETILHFIENYHYKIRYQCTILNNFIKCYTISTNGKTKQYYILGSEMTQPEASHYRFTILVKPTIAMSEGSNTLSNLSDDCAVIYLRTDDMSLLEVLDLEEAEKELIKLKVDFLKAKGLRFSMICQRKNPSEEEINSYLTQIKDPGKKFSLYSNYELLAIVAIKDKLQGGLRPIIQDFLTIENKVWLLTKDPEELAVSSAYLTGILTRDLEIIRLEIPSDSCNVNEAWIKIRAALNKIKKMLASNDQTAQSPGYKRKTTLLDKSNTLIKNRYSVLISGRTLEILAKDQDLLSHFVLVANFSRTLIGYHLSPKDKALLVSLIREQFPCKPVVMTIGDGFDDNSMTRKAHIGVNIRFSGEEKSKKKKFQYPSTLKPFSDLSLQNFGLLRELLRVKSLTYLDRIFMIVLYSYSATFLFIMPFGYYLMFFGIVTGQMIPPYLLLVKDLVILNLFSLLSFFSGNKYLPSLLKTFVWIYQDGRYMAEQIYKIAFWRAFFSTTLDALFVTLFLVYGLEYLLHGNVILYEEFSLLLFTAVYFMIFVKMGFYFRSPIIMVALIGIFSVFLYFMVALLTQNIQTRNLNLTMLNCILVIGEKKDLLLMIAFLVVFQFLRSFLNKTFIFDRFFAGNYGKILSSLEMGQKIEAIKALSFNKMAKRSLSDFNAKNISEAIRRIFKYKHMDFIVQEMLNPNEINVNESGYHRLTLKFKDPELEAQYMSQIRKFSMDKKKKITDLASAIYIILDLWLLLLTYKEGKTEYTNMALSSTVYTASLIFCRILLNFENIEFYYTFPRVFVPLCNLALNLSLMSFSIDNQYIGEVMIYSVILSIIFQSEYIEVFIHYFFMCLVLFLLFLIKVISNGPRFILSDFESSSFETPQKVSMVIEGLVIVGFEIYRKYKKEQTYRNIFLNERAIKQENKKIGELLSILVPSFVKESMIQGVQSLSEDQGDVTILFCDICNFDKIVTQEQQKIVHILDHLFRMFDTFCLENDVQKIETVGKTYMACAGLKAVESTLQTIKNKNSTQRVINLALNMMSFTTKRLTFGDNEKIKIKIGIHYGPVLAGVIGHHKPQFSLIGDTVNTTSRVCSTGEESKITISKQGFDNVHGNFRNLEFTERIVEAKGKGFIVTYQIKKRRKGKKRPSIVINVKKNEERKIMPAEATQNQSPNTSNLNQDLITIAKNIRTNIKKNTMIKGVSRNASNFNIPSNKDPSFITRSPKHFSRLTSACNIKRGSHANNPAPDYIENHQNSINVQDNKSEGMSFNRMCSELKSLFGEEGNSTFEKKHSFLKLTSSVSKSDGTNILQYIENEHLKALSSNSNIVIDKIEKAEAYPGQYNKNDHYGLNLRKNSGNTIEDEFFDKLKVKESSLEVLSYNPIWLSFKNTDPLLVDEFSEKNREIYFKENWASLSIFALVYLINTFLLILKKNDLDNFLSLMILRVLFLILIFAVLYIFKKRYSHSNFMRKILNGLSLLIASQLLIEFPVTNYLGMENTLEIIVFFVFAINFSYLFFLDNLILTIYVLVNLCLHILKGPYLEFGIVVGLLIACIIMIMNNHRVKLLNTFKNFNTLRVNIVKKNQQNNLIVNLLPTHILEKFLRNPDTKLNLIDEFEDVTILFADIAGFTKYSSSVSPQQVVAVLKDLFTEFDKLCLENCVYKLYTIGDCYVVLGLIDAEERDSDQEALNVLNMGFQMIEKIKEVKKRVSFHDIDMRIGIHTGKIIGGVIGTDIVRYDVYGKDVVIANKMESNGTEGNITVSEKTRDLLMKAFRDNFVFAYHKEVMLPAFGQTVKCYRVIDVRNDS